ncbi:hypothetical protein CHU94_01340 [Rhodoferax sp. TH121]|uniref:LysR family transcriptional regulator n=1 Tax=Rhodoferax sp. TH121 TaxID=2022803 RepID=UPI000B96D3F6|nr:LysR family transcriptional regulator [Rhodoferax sp. TH121]OYQ42836.1 hypothetical protein CHU94_01340 [Rhodoferax sp. TH121]
MDIKRLTHLVVLADKRNFARAAEALALSQPALTRSIQSAEAELDMRLFDRGTLAVTPTPAGEFVLERARRLVFESRCLKRDVALYRERKLGDTAFGVGPYPGATFIPPLLGAIRAEFPDIHLRVRTGNWELLAHDLRAETLEFFVADTRDLPADPDLVVRPLAQLHAGFFVRAAHPLAATPATTLAEMWRHGVLSVRVPATVQQLLAPLLGLPEGTLPPQALECDDVPTLLQVALASDSVLAAPRDAVVTALAAGTLVPLTVAGLPPLFSEMGVVTLRGRTPSPMADLLMRRLPGLSAQA